MVVTNRDEDFIDSNNKNIFEEPENKIIDLTLTIFGTFCSEDGSLEMLIYDFIKIIVESLNDKSSKTKTEKDEVYYYISFNENNYRLKRKDVLPSLDEKLEKLYEKHNYYEKLNYKIKNLPTKELKKEKLSWKMSNLLDFVKLLLTLVAMLLIPGFGAMMVLNIPGLEETWNASATMLFIGSVGIPATLTVNKFVVHPIDSLGNIFTDISNNRFIIHDINEELNKRKVIDKITGIKKEEDNGINIDRKKQKVMDKLLNKLKKILGEDEYQITVDELFKKEVVLEDDEYTKTDEKITNIESGNIAYVFSSDNAVKKKILVRK